MTIGKRAKKFYYEGVLKSSLRVYLDNRITKVVGNIVNFMIANYKYIGMCFVDDYLFDEYVKIANSIYRRYWKKLHIEEFSGMIMKKIKEDGRLELVTAKDCIFESISESKKLSCYYLVSAKVFGKKSKYRYSGGSKVYWTSGIEIDDKFVKEYIKNVFEQVILKSFWDSFKRSAASFKFNINKFEYCINSALSSNEFDCLTYFGKFSEDRIICELRDLAEHEDLKLIECGETEFKSYFLTIK